MNTRDVHGRPKRPGEVDGVDYIFVSKQQFEEWIDSKDLLEWALVYGEYKGIPQSRVCPAISVTLTLRLSRNSNSYSLLVRDKCKQLAQVLSMCHHHVHLVHQCLHFIILWS